MIAKGNTQVTLSGEDNRRLRMMAAQAGVSAKFFLSELIWEKWKASPLAELDKESEAAWQHAEFERGKQKQREEIKRAK